MCVYTLCVCTTCVYTHGWIHIYVRGHININNVNINTNKANINIIMNIITNNIDINRNMNINRTAFPSSRQRGPGSPIVPGLRPSLGHGPPHASQSPPHFWGALWTSASRRQKTTVPAETCPLSGRVSSPRLALRRALAERSLPAGLPVFFLTFV